MAIKIADTLMPMADFPAAMAKDIEFEDGVSLQDKFDNKELGGGDSSIVLSQAEYDALSDEEKMSDQEYLCYDTGRIYKLDVVFGDKKPVTLTFEEYKALEEAGSVEADVDYIIVGNESGSLLSDFDIEHGTTGTTAYEVIETLKSDVENLIDDETVSEKSAWSSQKTSDEIAKKESVYITDSIANTLYYACEYFGLDCRNQYQTFEVEVVDVKGQNLKFNSVYKHEVLHHTQVISENGITLEAIDILGTLAFNNASNYTIRVKHTGVCPDNIGNTLVTVIDRTNKNILASNIVGTKTQYRGSRSIDISTGGKLTFIYSSEYASQAGCYMLLSNFNTEPLLIELGRTNIGQFKVTATHKSQNVDTITVTAAGDEYSWCVLQF